MRLKAAGARTITLDLILAEPDRLSPGEFAKLFGDVPQLAPMIAEASSLPSNDDRLAAAIAGAPVTLGIAGEAGGSRKAAPPHARFAFAGDDPQGFVPRFSGVIGSLPVLTTARRGSAPSTGLPQRDQVLRRVPLLLSVGGTLYPSLPLETLRVACKETTIFVRSSGGSGVTAFGQRTGVESVRVGLDRAADRRQRRAVAAFRRARSAPIHLGAHDARRHVRREDRSPGATSSSAPAPWACSICVRPRSIPPCPASRSTRRRWSRCLQATT